MIEEKNQTESTIQPQKTKKKAKYTLFTFVLAIFIIQLTISNIQNINMNINYSGKIKKLTEKKNEELKKNLQLKNELENFNSDEILESIARNNLKMASKDEILIIINKSEEQEEIKEEKTGFFGKKKKKDKDNNKK